MIIHFTVFTKYWFINILRHIHDMEAKSSPQMVHFFTQCLPTAFTLKTMFVHISEREIFSPNCCKFAIECDCDSKISQNVQSWVFFGEIDGFLQEKPWYFSKSLNAVIFCRMGLKWYYFLKMSFYLICEVFWLKIRKFLKVEKLENLIRKQSILKKNALSFEKASSKKVGGRKRSRW